MIGTVEIFLGELGSESKGKPGEVKPVSAEPWQKVKKKQPVYSKDRYRTSRKSRMKILFSDNSLMALGPGAEMVIEGYRTKPKSKLRQGVIRIKKGLSMYIVNKSQKNKKSFFNIRTPTANLGARGTQGYIAVSSTNTLVANQAGVLLARNSNPNVGKERKSNWFEFDGGHGPFIAKASFKDDNLSFAQAPRKAVVRLGRMMKTAIPKNALPAPPTPLSPGALASFRNFVVGDIAYSGGGGNSLISVEESTEGEEEEEG
ncbi:FecR family protein [Nitrospinaceae bacterium]|nr:FecR family protein [Nitrospinaceae bacterium]